MLVPAPGDDDPTIPLALAQQLKNKEADSKGKAVGNPMSWEFFSIAGSMEVFRGESEAPSWWDYQPETTSDDMTYDCDANLGSPRPVDCNKLEYSQLGAGSDTVLISPHVPRILSTGIR